MKRRTARRRVHALPGLLLLLLGTSLLRGVAQTSDQSGFISDDFDKCDLSEGEAGWTFSDPLGGSERRIVRSGTGDAWLEVSVPGGVAHDPWHASYNAPRLMQPIANTDFEIEVKFLSSVTLGNQMQGILIEQDAGNYVRFDFHSTGSGLRIFAATTTNRVSTSRSNKAIAAGVPRYMRVKRVGNQWTQTYSVDGSTWVTSVSFSHSLTAARAGLFAGNAGTNPPAHTAQFDYAFSTGSPVVPEDGAVTQTFTLTTGATGSGTVQRNPSAASYTCGTSVTLTATPAGGWAFSGWSGDLTGNQNPSPIIMDSARTVTALFSQILSPTPPVITNVQVVPTHNSAVITWITNKPATSSVAYGLSQAYENGAVQSSTLVTSHSVPLNSLTAAMQYYFQVTSVAGGLPASSPHLSFQTLADPSGFVSDDFNTCSLDEGVGGWTFVNPLGGATRRVVGAGTGEAWLEIAVPAGVAHDPWNASYNAPRIMRAISNADFEIEVKFLSNVATGTQMQGILIEQNAGNYLRFDFHSTGSGLRIFAASTVSGVSTTRSNKAIAAGVPQYMRVKRLGNQWTQRYSYDGTTWTTAAAFSHTLIASRAGLFAGNAGTNPPAHVARFDYAFSTASPIDAEDAAGAGITFTLTTGVNGDGTVARNPDQSSYACGASVTLTATPDPGWTFTGWTGDVLSNLNPITIATTEDKTVTAHFVVNTPPVISNVSIVPGDTWMTVSWQTNELATARVDYGLTPGFELGNRTDNNLASDHTIMLTGLSPQSTYHLKLTSKDSAGASSSVAGVTATTTQVFPLTISNIQVIPGEFSATVSWVTNKPAVSSVSYGPTATYGLGTVSNTTLRQAHSAVLSGLSQATQYHYRISVTDKAGLSAQSGDRVFTTTSIAPVITVWYGDHQRFGHLGTPQRWINVLGNAHDPDGLQWLRYSLNGGPQQSLSVGPDNRRLASPGDFNIELAYTAVNAGLNEVQIIARDKQGHESVRSVLVDVTVGTVWPEDYTANWSSVEGIQDAGQVVDGLWALEGNTIRPLIPDYDRLIAIGDVTWANYEVTASITTRSADTVAGYPSPSSGPAIGIGLRWQGHVSTGTQPNWGYWPLGALAWYRWVPDGTEQFQVIGNRNNRVAKDQSGRRLELGRTYIFKVRVQTESDGRHLYQFKAWLAGQTEPAAWQLQIRNGNLADDPTHGSLLLVAHHVDASFGPITVVPIP